MIFTTKGSARAFILSTFIALALVVSVPQNSSAAQDADGFCQSYLLLGELAQGNGANPSVANMQLDYLADGASLTDLSIIPFEGQVVNPQFNGAAASTGFVAGAGTHPSGNTIIAPTVTGNNVDFSAVYSDLSDLMTYAWTYVTVPAGPDIDAYLAVAPDDSSVAYCNGVYLGFTTGWHNNNDVLATHRITLLGGQKNLIMVKVFEGGGGHNLRIRIQQTPDTGDAANSTPVPGITYGIDGSGYTYPNLNVADASRSLGGSSGIFTASGETLDVTVTVNRQTGSPEPLVTETFPAGWTLVGGVAGVTASQGTVAVTGNTIDWDFGGDMVGPTATMDYTVQIPAVGTGTFSGIIDTDVIQDIAGRTDFAVVNPNPIPGDTGPGFDWHGDIGQGDPGYGVGGIDTTNPSLAGSAAFSGGQFTITAAGADVWGTVDRCHIAAKEMTGDFVLEANVNLSDPGVDVWSKAGIMIRASIFSNDAQTFLGVRNPANSGAGVDTVLQWRDQYGGASAWGDDPQDNPNPARVRLVRIGNSLTGYYFDGADWVLYTTHVNPGISETGEVAACIFVTSHEDNGSGVDTGVDGELDTATGIFQNVSITPLAVSGATRSVSELEFTAGTPIHVTITLNRGAPGAVDVIETIPSGWTASNFNPSASQTGDTLTFSGVTGDTVEYDVTPPASMWPGGFDGQVVAPLATTPVGGVGAVKPADRSVFQEGVWPDATYSGARDAHIIMYAGAGDAAIHQNTGANAFIEEGDWYGVQNPFNDDPDGDTGPLPPDAPRGFDDNKLIVIGFDLDDVPAGSEIEEAWYRMWYFNERRTNGTTPSLLNDHTTYVHAISKPWGEGAGNGVDGRDAINGEVSWAFARTGLLAWDVSGVRGVGTDIVDPAIVSAQSAAPHGATFDVWVEYDVTDIVQYWVDNPGSNHGMKISQDDIGSTPTVPYQFGSFDYFSSENSDANRRPTLTVKFVPGLDAQNWSLYE